ncbi:MAG: redoxin family protein [Bryobacteraceae bacterium]
MIGDYGEGRTDAIDEYDSLLAKMPRDRAILYAAARAKYSRKTAEAIKHLQAALALQPRLGPAHALLAEIYASQSFRDKQKMREHLDDYAKSCPDSVDLSYAYGWLDDTDLQRSIADRAREVLNRKTPPPPGELLKLWSLESKIERSDRQQALRERMRADVDRLLAAGIPRTRLWVSALQYASEQLADSAIRNSAQAEMAKLYPRSSYPGSVAARKWRDQNPWPSGSEIEGQAQAYFARAQTAYREMWRAHSQHAGIASSYWGFTQRNRRSTKQELSEAFHAIKAVLDRDPDAMMTLPPVQCETAEALLRRDVRIGDVPPLVRKCIEITEKYEGAGTESDLHPRGKESQDRFRDTSYLYAYFPLVDAHIRLKQKASAEDILSQIETKLNRMRPPADASSKDKFRHEEMEARFWHMKGRFAELTGRKMDALILYRNSLITFPVRRPSSDSRDLVMADARRLWAEFGGTERGWNEWAATSSLDKFYAGAGKENAWAKLAKANPDLELTDTAGRKWKPSDLATRVTFINMWATWCGPCREELPYLEQLRERFKDRDSVSIIALNVDDETALVQPFLDRLKLDLPITLARDFAYEYFPTMAIPANWITGANGTHMFNSDADQAGRWLKNAAAAIEKALQPQP